MELNCAKVVPQRSALGELPVLFLTAHAEADTETIFLPGADDFT